MADIPTADIPIADVTMVDMAMADVPSTSVPMRNVQLTSVTTPDHVYFKIKSDGITQSHMASIYISPSFGKLKTLDPSPN